MKGRNKSFIINGIKMIFRRNWAIYVDSAYIDTSLSYSENFYYLYDKFVSLKEPDLY